LTNAAACTELFAELKDQLQKERGDLIARGASSEAERQQLAKALRDRWLARKSGIVARLDEHWLKPAAKELKPVVGQQFNGLRKLASGLEMAELVRDVPVGLRKR